MGVLMKYREVPRHSYIFYAEKRDFLDAQEMLDAKLKDGLEAETHKAWRSIMQGHDNIRYQIGEIRRALHGMGCVLTTRGEAYINALYRDGHIWYDPDPAQTLTNAQKTLLECIADMPRRWAALRQAERKEPNAR